MLDDKVLSLSYWTFILVS